MKTVKGIPASYGIAIGPAFVYERQDPVIECRTVDDPEIELVRFDKTRETARLQLGEIYEKAKAESGDEEAEIFQAQAMMLDDPELISAVKTIVQKDRTNVEPALSDTVENYARMLESLEDEYLSARALDVRDVGSRLLRILMGVAESPAENLKVPSIVIAKDLTPSDTILLDKAYVLGFCTSKGGATSHTAILARSLALPAVVGAGDTVHTVKDGTMIILDGDSGEVLIQPDQSSLTDYQARQEKFYELRSKADNVSHEPAITLDGYRVEVVANIGNVEGARTALDAGG